MNDDSGPQQVPWPAATYAPKMRPVCQGVGRNPAQVRLRCTRLRYHAEHVHLLISEPEAGTPSTVVQVLKQRSAGRRRHRESNQLSIFASEQHSFWQARFYDFNVFTNRKRVEKLRYMHRNPVKRGLAPSPEMWPWSSFRWYCFGEWRGVALCDWPEAKLQLKKIQRQPTLRSGNRTAKSAGRDASAKDGAPSGGPLTE